MQFDQLVLLVPRESGERGGALACLVWVDQKAALVFQECQVHLDCLGQKDPVARQD